MHYPLQGGRDVMIVRGVVDILDIHLSPIHFKVLFWVCGPIIQVYSRHLNLPVVGRIDDFPTKMGGEVGQP